MSPAHPRGECSSRMDAALLVPDPRVSARASSKAALHRAGGPILSRAGAASGEAEAAALQR
jgi:hypothetical protein